MEEWRGTPTTSRWGWSMPVAVHRLLATCSPPCGVWRNHSDDVCIADISDPQARTDSMTVMFSQASEIFFK